MLESFSKEYAERCQVTDKITAEMFDANGVLRGLRDKNGNGVVAGLTNISKIEAFRMENGQKIPCPTYWNRVRGLRNVSTKWEKKDPVNGRYIWDFTVIKDILMNPVYTGAIASQKKEYRFKIGTIGEKKPEEWIVVENQHEPLVDRKTFDIVQRKLKSRQRPRQTGEISLFAGLIKCGECGKSLTIRYTNEKHPKQIYSCKTYNAYGKQHCSQHRVEYDTLYRLALLAADANTKIF